MVTADQEVLTPSQAAARLGVCAQSLRNWATEGKVASVRTPLGRLYPVIEVERVAAERQAAKSAPPAVAAEP